MGRSNWRLNFISKSIISRLLKFEVDLDVNIRDAAIIKKTSIIPKKLYKTTTFILKGLNYRILKINRYNIGWRFGEFVLTRKPNIYPKKNKERSHKNNRR
jgi:ribosomal protein S19